MNKTNIFGTGIVILLILIVGKGVEGQASEPPLSPGINIVVILDTSDRISRAENPDQLDKDILITKGIVTLFTEILLSEIRTQTRNTWLHHQIAFVVPYQQGATPIPQNIIGKLRIYPTDQDRLRGSAHWVKEKRDELFATLDKLYQLLEQETTFTGSDIWNWFGASADLYLNEKMQNYIICVSDSYLDFDRSIQANRDKIGNKTSYIPYKQVVAFREDLNNWREVFDSKKYGLLEIEEDFSSYDVKFLMVEMKPRHMQVRDLPILKKYWRTWLESMGIHDSDFLREQSNSEDVKTKIKKFISPNRKEGFGK